MKLLKKLLMKLGFRLIKFGYPNALVILHTNWGHDFTEEELRLAWTDPKDSMKMKTKETYYTDK